jgi:hypothetical protein
MMLSRRLQQTLGDCSFKVNAFVRRSTGSNYIGHSNKEQGKKESFVRFSEQPLDITTVYRLQNSACNGFRDRFWEKLSEPGRREEVSSVAGIEQRVEEP